MPIPPYPIYCYGKGCEALAAFKIAARWSDGHTHELKTYSVSCLHCLADQFASSRQKQAKCRLTAGEKLDAPGIYELTRGQRDQHLKRRTDLERQFLDLPIDSSAPVP